MYVAVRLCDICSMVLVLWFCAWDCTHMRPSSAILLISEWLSNWQALNHKWWMVNATMSLYSATEHREAQQAGTFEASLTLFEIEEEVSSFCAVSTKKPPNDKSINRGSTMSTMLLCYRLQRCTKGHTVISYNDITPISHFPWCDFLFVMLQLIIQSVQRRVYPPCQRSSWIQASSSFITVFMAVV